MFVGKEIRLENWSYVSKAPYNTVLFDTTDVFHINIRLVHKIFIREKLWNKGKNDIISSRKKSFFEIAVTIHKSVDVSMKTYYISPCT